MKQQRAPVIELLQKHIAQKRISLHMPGHKASLNFLDQGTVNLLGLETFRADLTELPLTDDLHDPQGHFLRAQELAAELFGVAKTFFLVNGATVGLQGAMISLAKPGDKIILDRNMHRSVWAAMVLAGVDPIYVMPDFLAGWGMSLNLDTARLAQVIARHKSEAKAVFLMNPTYEGISAELCPQVELAHRAGLPVVVDEAHGVHFHFLQELPASAIDAGADVVVHGSHKYLGSLTQTAMLHVNQNDLAARIAAALRLLETTSPSFPLLVSLDGARRKMALEGEALWRETVEMAEDFRKKAELLEGVECLNRREVYGSGRDCDPTKIIIRGQRAGLSGYRLRSYLENEKIDLESAVEGYVLCLITPGNNREDLDKLRKALSKIKPQKMKENAAISAPPAPRVLLPPREAYYQQSEAIPFREAKGRVAGEIICPYPPGIPVLCPGEEITPEIFEYLAFLKGTGTNFQAAGDKGLQTLKVLEC